MQEEYRPLVEDATSRCRTYFAEKLIAAYLHGSIAMNDAIPNVSDLDYYFVVSEALTKTDEQYLETLETELQLKYPIIDGVHLSVHSVDELRKDKFARFVLKYNAHLIFGEDVVSKLAEDDCAVCEPNRRLAKGRLAFARKCFENALNHQQPMNTGEIPANTYYAARKYARYFVIIEGAYFLMTRNQFRSFVKEEVLQGLKGNCDEFHAELELTEKVLYDPIKAGITHEEYLMKIRPFVEWMFDCIENPHD